MNKKNKKDSVIVILIISFSLIFLITSVLFKVYGIDGILAQLIGALLGTIITAIVTLLLLGVQSDKEFEQDKASEVFVKKQEVYHRFLEELEKITEDGKITIDENQDELQKLIFQLGLLQMHADKKVAEDITAYVGEIIGIITSEENKNIKSKKYTDLSEKVFAIVELLRSDLYGKSSGVINPDYFYISLSQSRLFGHELRNAESMKRLHIKWWELLIKELEKKRGKLDFLFYENGMQEIYTPKEAVLSFENENHISFNIAIKPIRDGNCCFYFDYAYDSPSSYGFEIQSKNSIEKSIYYAALPEGFSIIDKQDSRIGARNIESKYDIDFYGTNRNYFDFAKANEKEKAAIVKSFAEEINNSINEFLENLENNEK